MFWNVQTAAMTIAVLSRMASSQISDGLAETGRAFTLPSPRLHSRSTARIRPARHPVIFFIVLGILRVRRADGVPQVHVCHAAIPLGSPRA